MAAVRIRVDKDCDKLVIDTGSSLSRKIARLSHHPTCSTYNLSVSLTRRGQRGVGRKAPLPLDPLRCAFSPTNLKRPTQVFHSPMLRSPPARQQIGKALPLVCFQPQHPSLLTAAFRKQAAHKHKTSLCRHRQACSTMGYSLPAAPNPQSTLLRRHHGCL